MSNSKHTTEEGSLRDLMKKTANEIHELANYKFRHFLFEDADTANRDVYRHFLLQMYVVYTALETELEKHSSNPLVGPIHFPDELNRVKFLEKDLDFYYKGKPWRKFIERWTTDSAKRWASRIHKVAKTQPELLLAYSYARYFADIGGGQILNKMLLKRFNLKDQNGINYYDFSHIESIEKLRDLYSARMNALPLTKKQTKAMNEESLRSFQFNVDLINDVREYFIPGGKAEECINNSGIWDMFMVKNKSIAVCIVAVMLILPFWSFVF